MPRIKKVVDNLEYSNDKKVELETKEIKQKKAPTPRKKKVVEEIKNDIKFFESLPTELNESVLKNVIKYYDENVKEKKKVGRPKKNKVENI